MIKTQGGVTKTKDLKCIFAPLGVAVGLTVFMTFGILISRAIGLQGVMFALGPVLRLVLAGLGVMMVLLFGPVFVAVIYRLGWRGAIEMR